MKRLFCYCLLCLCALLSAQTLADDADQKREQLQKLEKEMAELRKLLDEFRSQRSDLQNALRKSEVDIGKIQNQVRKIQEQLDKEQGELKSLQNQRGKLQGAKRDQQKLIEQQILAAYQIGQQKKLKVLLNQEQPDKVTRALTYYDYFNQARSEQIETYTDIIHELNSLEPRIAEKADRLARARSELDQQHKQLLSRKKDREKNLALINSAIANKDQELKQAARDRRELERLLETMEQTLANIQIPSDYRPFVHQKGKLQWPVNGKALNRFGSRREGTSLRWQGVNINAREGSTVKAIHHGRVVFADWLRGTGLLLIIDHGDGYMSLYAHNESLLKETGDWVAAGEPVATVGSSGGKTRAGLYFEIRHNGKPTDPRHWCRV